MADCGKNIFESRCLLSNSLANKDMQVVMGDLSLNMTEGTEQTLMVEEAILHESFRETPTAVYNDIGNIHIFG